MEARRVDVQARAIKILQSEVRLTQNVWMWVCLTNTESPIKTYPLNCIIIQNTSKVKSWNFRFKRILQIYCSNQIWKWPPFALTISSKRLVTEWHERRTTSSSKADYRGRAFLRAATLEYDLSETSLSKIDQRVYSIQLMYGLKEGYMFLSQNLLK